MYFSLQGNMGLGKAIEYFTSIQCPISIPLNDTQPYDLIVDFNGKLNKIQVKTTRNLSVNNTYTVNLRSSGGNRTGKARDVPFDNNSCDYLFVYSGDEKIYLIPSNEIWAKTAMRLGKEWEKFIVVPQTLNDFLEKSN